MMITYTKRYSIAVIILMILYISKFVLFCMNDFQDNFYILEYGILTVFVYINYILIVN